MTRGQQKLLRCAIYTRVSDDQGLEQEFNSRQSARSRRGLHQEPSPRGLAVPTASFFGQCLPCPARRRRWRHDPLAGGARLAASTSGSRGTPARLISSAAADARPKWHVGRELLRDSRIEH
jgi:hypothetical protein